MVEKSTAIISILPSRNIKKFSLMTAVRDVPNTAGYVMPIRSGHGSCPITALCCSKTSLSP
jgi:hypothetical protein